MKATHNKPGVIRQLLCALLAFVLTAALLVTGVLGIVSALMFNTALHEDVALDNRVIDAQMERIAQKVTAISETYPFDAETILQMIDRDSVIDLNREMIAWWMDIVQGAGAAERPVWQGGDVAAAIREDEYFLENVPADMQKATARDKIAPAISAAVSEAVLPVRGMLIDLAVAKVLDRLPLARIAQLVNIAPWAMLGMCVMLEGMILLLCRRYPRARALWGASPLAACGIVVLALVLMVLEPLNLPQRISVMSPFAAIQVKLLMERVACFLYATAGACLLIGAAWMLLANRRVRRGACRKAAA